MQAMAHPFRYILEEQQHYLNTMRHLGLLSLIILLFSCNNNAKDYYHYQSTLEKTIGIKISDDFTLIEYNSDFAIGDYNERFKLKLSEKDFSIVLNSIDSSELKKIINMNLYYFNINNTKGEFISIIFDPTEYTVQYSMNSE
jgi:hypothetical protein